MGTRDRRSVRSVLGMALRYESGVRRNYEPLWTTYLNAIPTCILFVPPVKSECLGHDNDWQKSGAFGRMKTLIVEDPMARKVILDVDPGIDDALAMCLAFFEPDLDVIAVTAVGGNVSPNQATRNVQVILEQLDPPRWPRLGAASEPENGLPVEGRYLYRRRWLGRHRIRRRRAAAHSSFRKGDLRHGSRRAARGDDRRPGSADEYRPGVSCAIRNCRGSSGRS